MVRVDDEDDTANPSDLIDRVVVEHRHPSSPAFTPTVTMQGIYGRVTMQFRFRVTCGTNYHGPYCATFCMPQDSDELGHYTCDSNGRKVCNLGYTGEDCLTGKRIITALIPEKSLI